MHKKDYKTRCLIILMIFTVLFMFSGCSDESSGSSEYTKNSQTDNLSGSMKIYVYSYDERTLKAIDEFNAQSKIKINPTILKDENDGNQYREKIVTSMLSGNGPDIVLDNAYWFPALWKNAGNGVFYDLNQIIKRDKEFNIDDYNTDVMDKGIIGGKRYFMPLGFRIPLMWSTEKILNDNKIRIDEDNFTWEQMQKIVIEYINKTNDSSKKYFVGLGFNISSIVNSSWSNWVDLAGKKAYFDSSNFIKILEMYRKIYPAICPDEILTKQPGLHFDLLKNNSLIMVNGSSEASPYELWRQNSTVKQLLGSNMKLFPYPVLDGHKNVDAQLDKFIAVGSYSKYKNEAFNFVKLLLSEKYQGDTSIYIDGVPVNKRAYEKIANEYQGEAGKNKKLRWSKDSIISVSLPKELYVKTDKFINNTNFELMDVNIIDMVEQEVNKYIEGKQSAKQAAREINNRVMLYLNE